MPSIEPPTAPACSRTRSPSRNGRALSSTMPANRLPERLLGREAEHDRRERAADGERLQRDAGDASAAEHRRRDGDEADQELDGAGRGRIHAAEQRRRDLGRVA